MVFKAGLFGCCYAALGDDSRGKRRGFPSRQPSACAAELPAESEKTKISIATSPCISESDIEVFFFPVKDYLIFHSRMPAENSSSS